MHGDGRPRCAGGGGQGIKEVRLQHNGGEILGFNPPVTVCLDVTKFRRSSLDRDAGNKLPVIAVAYLRYLLGKVTRIR